MSANSPANASRAATGNLGNLSSAGLPEVPSSRGFSVCVPEPGGRAEELRPSAPLPRPPRRDPGPPSPPPHPGWTISLQLLCLTILPPAALDPLPPPTSSPLAPAALDPPPPLPSSPSSCDHPLLQEDRPQLALSLSWGLCDLFRIQPCFPHSAVPGPYLTLSLSLSLCPSLSPNPSHHPQIGCGPTVSL